jgi:hypothetical protein
VILALHDHNLLVGWTAGWRSPKALDSMDESALDIEGLTLSPQKEVVRFFYKELWDHADKRLIPFIFHEGFTFRGSFGPTLVGHDQFAGYVDFVTETFGQYPRTVRNLTGEVGNEVIAVEVTRK